MGLGMARAGSIVSSIPDQDEEIDPDFVDVEDSETEEEIDPLEAEAQAEGYASQAERQAAESQAREQGWRPLAEYAGKPGGWKSAKQFIADGENYLPFVKKQLRESRETNTRMANEMEGLRTEMVSTRADMQKLLDFSRKANQAGYDKAKRELQDAQRQAVVDGDVATFDKIKGQIEEMDEARDEVVAPAPAATPTRQPPAARVDVKQEYEDFLADNPWFNTDKTLNVAMIGEHNIIMAESPAMPLADQLERAKEAVMARFPKKFGISEDEPPRQPQPRRPQAPLPPSNRPRVPAGRTGIEAIADPRERAEARFGYQSAKKSMPNLTEAEYLEILADPHGDVLETISKHTPKK